MLMGSAMATVGCTPAGSADPPRPHPPRGPLVADHSVVHAFDTNLETRLLDRLELDHFLRQRDITFTVVDGTVEISGEVWTPLERQRASDLVRNVAGVIGVANHLDVRPPV